MLRADENDEQVRIVAAPDRANYCAAYFARSDGALRVASHCDESELRILWLVVQFSLFLWNIESVSESKRGLLCPGKKYSSLARPVWWVLLR